MANPKTIKVDNVEYVQKGSEQVRDIGPKRIIVADRGWVFAGNCEDMADGSVVIRNAQNIRVWGTTRGLGELINGPLSTTKLDPCGEVRVTPIVTINILSGW